MREIYFYVSTALLLVLTGCGIVETEENQKQAAESMIQEEAMKNPAPEYIVVKATEDGGTEMASTNEDVIRGTESQVASAENNLFSSISKVEALEGDESAAEGSSESYHYGKRGKRCFRVLRRSLSSPIKFDKNQEKLYRLCSPVFRNRYYRTVYQFVGRSYNKKKNSYYNRYRRSQAYFRKHHYKYGEYNHTSGYGRYKGSNRHYDHAPSSSHKKYGNGVYVGKSGRSYYTGRNYGSNYDSPSYSSSSYGNGY